jgi:REP element-mobilizing transposase RayT
MASPRLHNRKEIRLKGYDYSSPGEYFVTICTERREHLFEKVVANRMVLRSNGKIAVGCLNELPMHYPTAELDEFVVMPNHIHGIIRITDEPVRARHASPEQKRRNNLGDLVGSFKSAVTNRVNKIRNTPGVTIWQRGYFEHVIRDDRSLHKIRDYIATNPQRWSMDAENDNRFSDEEAFRHLTS